MGPTVAQAERSLLTWCVWGGGVCMRGPRRWGCMWRLVSHPRPHHAPDLKTPGLADGWGNCPCPENRRQLCI